ncbi:MAG: sulfotransferase [Tildeniella nuda ZEHNDER 1965/U140]|jgi:hypothetical protein|nr:sulfotransferase [Tildeniella nuda ZEHNDER 1965/U140]
MRHDGNSKQPVLLIAGMHRSGTSLTASLLQSAGVDVGQHLLEGNTGNLKGHFENLDFLNFHQDVLRSTGICEAGWTLKKSINVPEYYIDAAKLLVSKNASLTQPWAWKDPRTTLFLNFWGNLIPEAKFIFIYRSPWEVVDSLYRRGDEVFSHNPQFALDLWTNYNQVVLDFYSSFSDRCFLIHLNQITSDPTAFIESVSQQFSLSLNPPKEELYDASSLKTQTSYSQRALMIQRYFPDAYSLYQQLNNAAGFSDDSTHINQELVSPTAWLLKDWLDLQGLSNRVADLQSHFSASQAELVKMAQERHQLQDANQQLQDANRQLQNANQQLQEVNQALQKDVSTCIESTNDLKEQLSHQLDQTHAAIAAMKTSKFWKLRTQWIQFKQLFHLKE